MSVSAPAAGGSAGTGGGQAAPQPASSQPTPGQGQGQGGGSSQQTQGQSGFNWGNFPNVPEGQRELLEPHLKEIQGYITRMEQQHAPYKGLTELVDPDNVENLVAFLNNYSTDPVATWLGLAQALQEEGHIQNPEFSIDSLQQMLAQQQAPADPTMPEWAQQMQQQMQELVQARQMQEQMAQQQAAQAEAQQQEQMLAEAHSTMYDMLKKAGIPNADQLVTTEQLTGALIAHKGDIDQAVASFTGLRDGFLKGFTETNGKPPAQPRVNGMPQVPKGGLRPRGGDTFRSASVGAQQFLAQNAAAAGQE